MSTRQTAYTSLLSNHSGYANTYGSVNGSITSETDHIMEANTSGKISNARRFFILLAVFDVLFIFLIWIICALTSGDYTVSSAFEKEVEHYSIHSSMFDVVLLAAFRFILILLFYALLKISHWWVIAVTTAGSGAFIIAKVFLYDWSHSVNKTASVVLLLISFVISWGEAWFLDFKVIPKEAKALAFQATHDPERIPVLPPQTLSRSHSDDGSAFYSPPGSDDDENEKEHDGSTVSEVEWLSPKAVGDGPRPSDQEYRKLAEEAMETALNIIFSDGWRTEKTDGEDIIYSQSIPKFGKVFKFVGVLNFPPEKVIDEVYFKGEEMHKWNPTVKRVKILQRIDEHIDVAHVIATEGAAGLVASRDFVNVRIWKKRGDVYIHASMSTTHPDSPVMTKYVRGEQGPCVYVISPLKTDPRKCQLQWLLNTNLKGWLPQYLIDQTLSTVMLEYVQSLRKQAASSDAIV